MQHECTPYNTLKAKKVLSVLHQRHPTRLLTNLDFLTAVVIILCITYNNTGMLNLIETNLSVKLINQSNAPNKQNHKMKSQQMCNIVCRNTILAENIYNHYIHKAQRCQ